MCAADLACNHAESSERIESSIEDGSRHGVVVKTSSDSNFEKRMPSQSQGFDGLEPTSKEDILPLQRGGRANRMGWRVTITADAVRLVQQRGFAFSRTRPSLTAQRSQS
jgi:hypothetical protein